MESNEETFFFKNICITIIVIYEVYAYAILNYKIGFAKGEVEI